MKLLLLQVPDGTSDKKQNGVMHPADDMVLMWWPSLLARAEPEKVIDSDGAGATTWEIPSWPNVALRIRSPDSQVVCAFSSVDAFWCTFKKYPPTAESHFRAVLQWVSLELPHEYMMSDQPHRRFNPLQRTWVLCSPHRAQRPWQGQVEAASVEQLPHYDPACQSPICFCLFFSACPCSSIGTPQATSVLATLAPMETRTQNMRAPSSSRFVFCCVLLGLLSKADFVQPE